MNEKKYVLKVKKYDRWKAEIGHGENLHIDTPSDSRSKKLKL